MRTRDLDNWLSDIEAEAEVIGSESRSNAAAATVEAPAAAEAPAEPRQVLSDLWSPSEAGSVTATDVAGLLLDRGLIRHEQATQARTVSRQASGKTMAEVLIEMGVKEAGVQQAVADLAHMPFERFEPRGIDEAGLGRLGNDFCKANGVMPIRMAGTRLVVGITDPRRLFVLDEVRRKLGRPVKVVLVTAGDVRAAVEAHSEEPESQFSVDDIIQDIEEDDVEVVAVEEEDVDLEKQAGESPVIRFVNFLIYNACKSGASDIHIEPHEKRLRIRYRIDGVLFEQMNPPHTMHAAIVSRLKIMANLDISERRLPQDGRIRAMVHGRKLDLRLSTLPTGYGEKAVMRILDSRSVQISLDELGMPADQLVLWKKQIVQPHGIILVTGPTGSGKTTTLYSSLNQMDRNKLNISTVEDPIEYHLAGISQVNTHEKIGMTFAAALRSLLRQDPDVVMVGEIRDEETARIAVQAALTGHLVLSTLHTNDAPGSITRLINIGVEPYLIGAAVNAVLAQRLVRRICPGCRTPTELSGEMADLLEMHGVTSAQVFHGAGCDACRQTGYAGRVGIYELLVLDDVTRDAIAARPSVTEFRRLCTERGMVTLRADGFAKVAEGRTTFDEVLRVTQATI